LRDKKYLRAEKALLTILRVDERNATAYNRLGILYSKQQAYEDAIECFEIAQSLEPSASSLHNVGLIYYETQAYDKAALAFEQALGMEEDLAARHIAYAKVQEKLGNNKRMITALERAVELEKNPQTLTILADAYDRAGQSELSTDLREQAAKMIVPEGQPKRVKQPRRVVM
jgi:tetratricopeptide (TPR) repeat protein